MFQSRMFSSQSLVDLGEALRDDAHLAVLDGAKRAGVASGVILTNHCIEISGSMTVPQRWQWPSGMV